MSNRLLALAGAWLVGVLLCGGALWLVVTSDHTTDKAATAALAITAGLSFITTGLIAIWRRPDNRTGALMAATGYLWLLAALNSADDPWVFTLGFVVNSVAWGAFAWLILAYPSGRLASRSHAYLVASVWALVLVEGAALVLVDGTDEACGSSGCPASTIAIWHSHDVARAIVIAGTTGAIAVIVAALVVLSRRWRAATPALRRALGGVLLTSGTTLVLLVVVGLVDTVSDRWSRPFEFGALAAFGTVPLAFLAGVLRSRLARSAAGELLLTLGGGVALRDALAGALHDPTLEVGYWVSSQERYLDSEGEPVRADQAGRGTRLVERDGRPIAVLVHDPMLLDEPELVDAVATAAGLWLENERLQADHRAQYRFLETIVNTAPSLLVNVDRNGRIRNFNNAVERVSGLDDPEQIRGRFFWDVFINPDEQEAMQARFHQAAPGFAAAEYENTFTNARGAEVVIAWSTVPLQDEDGVTRGIIAGGLDITERKRQELELRGKEERLAAVIQSSPVAIVELTLEDEIIAWNPAAERIFGWAPEEVVGRPIPFVPTELREEADRLDERVRTGETFVGHETVRRRKDGAPIDVALAAAPVHDPSGAIVGSMGIYADITERRHKELQLQSSEERLRASIESSPVAIIEVGLDSMIRTWNPAAERIFGWTADEAHAESPPMIPDERLPEYEQLLGQVRGGDSYTGHETQRRRKDGTLVDVEISSAPIRDSDGDVVGHMVLIVDITERKRQELELRASDERLRAAIESSPAAVVEVDLDDRVLAWNPAAEQLFGWTRDEAIGRPVPFVGPDETGEFRRLVEDVRAGRVYSGYETTRHRKDGSPIEVSVSAAPVRDSSGAVVSHMALFADISERKQREVELQGERDFLDKVGETVPSMLVLTDREGLVLPDGANRAYREAVGRPTEECAGRSFLELVHPDDDFQTRMAIAAAANGVERTDVENRWLRSDGEPVVVAWSATPIWHPRAGELVLISGVDVTERRGQEEEIRASRARIVQAGDAARRRLERNLHDGAQQRLVSLSLSLRLAEVKLDGDAAGARQLLAGARDELALAIDELRELARGIHPAVLTDRGLAAAVEALVGRCPVPVEWDVIEERLPPAVEAAAYYVVSEALANVAKYAGATSAAVRISSGDERVSVVGADDGVGGADPAVGTGLRGLVDRVAALDGTLKVESPPGGGTRIVAEIPVREPALTK